MARYHALVVFGVGLGLGGCGDAPKHVVPDSDSRPPNPPDAFIPDAPPSAAGMRTHYVVSAEHVPTTTTQARDFGLDLGGVQSNVPDGTVDNQLGSILAAFVDQGFPIQAAVDASVAHGTTLILVDLQTDDFHADPTAGMNTMLGDNPSPAPCNGSGDLTCGHHLDGNGVFDVVAGSSGTQAVGSIGLGTLTAVSGDMVVQLAMSTDQTPAELHLHNARVRASGMSATGITSAIVGGVIDQGDVDNQFLPALHAAIVEIVTAECPNTNPNATPPCGCPNGSAGATLIGLFDTDPKDCSVSQDEVSNNTLIKNLTAPDVCREASCTKPDGLSFGVELVAVPGTFTFP